MNIKDKYISRQSGALLSYFLEKGQDRFDSSEVFKALPGSSKGAIMELLSDMARRGLLFRLRKGMYQIIPYEQDATNYIPDWHLAAGALVKTGNHYIGYYSALQLHQLTTQPALTEQVVVSKQQRPSSMVLQDVTFQFIYHNPAHFFGSQKIWVDNYNQVLCSDLEKTIIDCLFMPEYAGGIGEIAKAIFTGRKEIEFEKLLSYVEKFHSQAVVKRLGFLLEILGIDSPIIETLRKIKTTSYVPLDTELPKTGPFVSRWSIQQNLDTETIQSAIVT